MACPLWVSDIYYHGSDFTTEIHDMDMQFHFTFV
jgi:hypothetical protein